MPWSWLARARAASEGAGEEEEEEEEVSLRSPLPVADESSGIGGRCRRRVCPSGDWEERSRIENFGAGVETALLRGLCL